MDIGVQQEETRSVAFVRRTVRMDEIRGLFDEAFGKLPGLIADAGGTITAAPFGWYHGMPSDVIDVSVGFPVEGMAPGTLAADEDVMVDERIGGRAVVAVHVGSYEALGDSYGQVMAWIEENGEVPRDDFWEEYVSDPTETSESELQTRIVVPVR
ncbi:GyrI-like domain-containing protein [Actinomarinicola tropica]|uniref:AraC family transcriptional regulator n=1 Tax=Actinomarinicola tropica TaxID=2789776 RepID=A0A5Q2RJ04_9ACTN|nr:GyrI-like domain-containing protein [Actinomarinicola tropica]QGG93987.1 AraC family transcriptional regulator [Actinomarinicola tropica]